MDEEHWYINSQIATIQAQSQQADENSPRPISPSSNRFKFEDQAHGTVNEHNHNNHTWAHGTAESLEPLFLQITQLLRPKQLTDWYFAIAPQVKWVTKI